MALPEPDGPKIGEGRAADVFDLGDGSVLRRVRSGRNCEVEARAMRWLHDAGVPVPAVRNSSGPDIVMERVDGPTMLDDLTRRPWRIVAHARVLARLQRQVNDLLAPEWFPRREGIPTGERVLHLDLHPMNVILAARGPVLIDWSNVSRGQASFDAAMSFLIMSAFETSGIRDRVGQRVLVESFVALRGRRVVRSSLHEACVHRLTDPNVTPGERVALEAVANGGRRFTNLRRDR